MTFGRGDVNCWSTLLETLVVVVDVGRVQLRSTLVHVVGLLTRDGIDNRVNWSLSCHTRCHHLLLKVAELLLLLVQLLVRGLVRGLGAHAQVLELLLGSLNVDELLLKTLLLLGKVDVGGQ